MRSIEDGFLLNSLSQKETFRKRFLTRGGEKFFLLSNLILTSPNNLFSLTTGIHRRSKPVRLGFSLRDVSKLSPLNKKIEEKEKRDGNETTI